MKVVLLQDVPRTGRRNEVKEVPDGLAINYLIARKLALPATPKNVAAAKRVQLRRLSQQHEARDQFVQSMQRLSENPVTLRVATNPQGNLYKSVRAEDVAKAGTEHGAPLSPEQIELIDPIKGTGEYTIPIHHDSDEGYITIHVLPA